MGRARSLAVAVCLCLGAVVAEGGQEVAGEVKDSTGGVLLRATITLRASVGDFRRDASTDARGRYRFQNVPAGDYVLLVTRDGFSPVTKEITLSGSDPATVDITLSPASFSEEVTVSFTGSHSTALKTDTPTRDIPLSVQSYTSSFMKAIETTNLSDLYNYTIGVSRAAPDAFAFTIRGMGSGSTGNNLSFNGLPGLAARFGSPSTENVERIEVLKGPAAVLYGQAQPGGIINIVTKKPQAESAHLVDIRTGTFFGTGPSFGDDNRYHVATDLTGPIDRDRRLLYRLVAAYDDVKAFRDFAKSSEVYAVPSLSWLGWQGTILNVEFEYRRRRTSLDNGLVAPNNDIKLAAAITTRYQEPNDYQNEEGKTASLSLNKVFANDLTWNVSWRSVWTGDETKGYENVSVQGFTLTRRDRFQVNARRYHFLDTTLRKPVRTGSIHHNLLFGVYGGYEVNDFDQRQFNSAPSLSVNVYQFNYGAPGLPPKPGTHQYTTFKNYAAYFNDQIELTPKWKAVAGFRFTRQAAERDELRINPHVNNGTTQAVLPLAGLVFEPDRTWSLYGSFSTSFFPANPAAVDVNGVNSFKPETGQQFEVGAKAVLGNGRGEATLALFNITKNDVLLGLTTAFPNFEQIGQERSRGLEVSLRHKILNNWQLIFGYGYTDAHVTKDLDPTRIGAQTQNAPKHNGNLWSRYDIAGGTLRGLGFGLGLVYSGDRAGTLSSTTSPLVLRLPSYFRVDAGLYYVSGRYELTARIVNLLDETYFEANSALGGPADQLQLRPGEPRAATVSLRWKF